MKSYRLLTDPYMLIFINSTNLLNFRLGVTLAPHDTGSQLTSVTGSLTESQAHSQQSDAISITQRHRLISNIGLFF